MTVGQLLRKLRMDAKVSQQKLANRIGWSESRVSKVERDISNNIGIRTIEKYLSGLDIPFIDFYKKLYQE